MTNPLVYDITDKGAVCDELASRLNDMTHRYVVTDHQSTKDVLMGVGDTLSNRQSLEFP